ncbi:hypothetical protein PC129_g19219 [Phytophthora cactorum]|uniref:Uncharacterized protein n=1 Tax=Phytophthora cactorum TaxID=29920 RepID=A0A8T1JV68_9STRA|nr:hypothetical protein PC111_g19677 [Phytophthora cactorum]KAG2830906.1 hypothetical protein PC112_g7506 [Phytophthora cactorum]KAG2861078.1 hypothetical protein PC113_g7503 [Phytophthora cactorum]KAG2879979.1 hypothetical protein PC114_g22292 [Phytophthora cactorum]KAG2889151.1 hypothetical protein PC115_g19823 [Phytophthora cactorum]
MRRIAYRSALSRRAPARERRLKLKTNPVLPSLLTRHDSRQPTVKRPKRPVLHTTGLCLYVSQLISIINPCGS